MEATTSTDKAQSARFLSICQEDGKMRRPVSSLFKSDRPVVALKDVLSNLARYADLEHYDPNEVEVQCALEKASDVLTAYPHHTLDEILSLVLYTGEYLPAPQNSLYWLMNAAFRSQDREEVVRFADYVWILLRALCKLPEREPGLLYRGAKLLPADIYLKLEKDAKYTLSAFSSCATEIGVMKSFAGDSGPRTVIMIKSLPGEGRDIREFSMFPGEKEVLCAPNMRLCVEDWYPAGGGLTMVTAQQLSTADCLMKAARKGLGLVSLGVVLEDPAAAASEAHGCSSDAAADPGALPLVQWRTDHVVWWLRKVNLVALQEIALNEKLNGKVLGKMADVSEVRKLLPAVSLGDADALADAVTELKAEEAKKAAAAAKAEEAKEAAAAAKAEEANKAAAAAKAEEAKKAAAAAKAEEAKKAAAAAKAEEAKKAAAAAKAEEAKKAAAAAKAEEAKKAAAAAKAEEAAKAAAAAKADEAKKAEASAEADEAKKPEASAEEWANVQAKFGITQAATEINLNGRKDVTDADVKAVAEHCPKLKKVYLTNTNVSDVAIRAVAEHCPNLEWVDLGNTNVSDIAIRAVAEHCPNLTLVYLHNTNVSDVAIRALAEHCRNLNSIRLSGTNVSDVAIKALAEHCRNLNYVDLENTNVSDIAIRAVAEHCPNLTHVYLSNTNVSDVAIRAVAEHCPNLEQVHLHNTNVSDVAIRDLRKKIPYVYDN